jgi:hypothetical protein
MEAPALFLQPSSSPACAVDRLKPLLPAMASPDVRYFAVQVWRPHAIRFSPVLNASIMLATLGAVHATASV